MNRKASVRTIQKDAFDDVGARCSRALLLSGEDGAGYSLSYVMAFPVFVLVICLVVEASLLLTCKCGVTYAAYAAVRAAIVYQSARPARADEKARQAATNALVAFSGSSRDSGGGAYGAAYARAYARFSGDTAHQRYVQAKFAWATRATSVELSPDVGSLGPHDEVTATVAFDAPLHVPGIARLIGGRRSGPNWVYRITSSATLPNDGSIAPSRDGDKPLGVRYESQ